MHHCARTYIPKVAWGEVYLFSARQGEKRVATIEVKRTDDGRVVIKQMRGPCNAILDGKMQATLRRWVGQRAKWRVPEPRRGGLDPRCPLDDAADDDIPF